MCGFNCLHHVSSDAKTASLFDGMRLVAIRLTQLIVHNVYKQLYQNNMHMFFFVIWHTKHYASVVATA